MEDPLHYYHAIINNDRPSSLAECIQPDGSIDNKKYLEYMEKEDDLAQAERNIFNSFYEEDDEPVEECQPKKKRLQQVKSL